MPRSYMLPMESGKAVKWYQQRKHTAESNNQLKSPISSPTDESKAMNDPKAEGLA